MNNRYDYTLKKDMDINIVILDEYMDRINDIARIYMVRYNDLSRRIRDLPEGVQVFIFIYAMKKYWKNKLIQESIVPLYSKYNMHLLNYKRDMVINNIHFLHLDFNTLPENKKYILGCQCKYCINYPRDEKDKLYEQVDDDNSFLRSIKGGCHDFGNGITSPNLYNEEQEYISYVTGYNYMKDKVVDEEGGERGLSVSAG